MPIDWLHRGPAEEKKHKNNEILRGTKLKRNQYWDLEGKWVGKHQTQEYQARAGKKREKDRTNKDQKKPLNTM